MIYINPRFPKTKQEYSKVAEANTDQLIERMKNILVKEPIAKEVSTIRPRAVGGGPWSYQEQKKKAKTFTLK